MSNIDSNPTHNELLQIYGDALEAIGRSLPEVAQQELLGIGQVEMTHLEDFGNRVPRDQPTKLTLHFFNDPTYKGSFPGVNYRALGGNADSMSRTIYQNNTGRTLLHVSAAAMHLVRRAYGKLGDHPAIKNKVEMSIERAQEYYNSERQAAASVDVWAKLTAR